MEEGVIRNLIRVGRISTLDKLKGTCRVMFDDKDNIVSGELCIMEFVNLDKLNIEDQVLCIFLPNGIQVGFCLGKFYSEINIPGGTK